MSDLEIRPAVRADDAALAELDRRTWSPMHAITPRPEPGTPFFDLGHPPEEFLVAQRGGRIVGCVQVVRPITLLAGAHVRQIQGLTVDQRERRRGTGRTLIDAACALARRQGARRVTLRLLSTNEPARRLYEAAGFRVEGVLPDEFFVDGRYVDDILMGRRLD